MERYESDKDLVECCDHPLHDVSGDVIIRDRLTVCGNLRAHKVDPAERGLFLTEESLRESCTVCRKGDWALVGEESPFNVYRWDNGWYDTGYTHEVNIPLNEYLTKEEALRTYVSDAELQAEKTAREQADDTLAQGIAENTEDIVSLNTETTNLVVAVEQLKNRDLNEIPKYSGDIKEDEGHVVVNNGTSTPTKIVFVSNKNVFAALSGGIYYTSWGATSQLHSSDAYNYNNVAISNKIYCRNRNILTNEPHGLMYYDGSAFTKVNDNGEIEEQIAQLENVTSAHENTLVSYLEWRAGVDESLASLDERTMVVVNLGEVSSSIVAESKAVDLAGNPDVVFIKYFDTGKNQVGFIRQQYKADGNTLQFLTLNGVEYVRTVNYTSGLKGSWKNIDRASLVHSLRYDSNTMRIAFYDPIQEVTFGGVSLPDATEGRYGLVKIGTNNGDAYDGAKGKSLEERAVSHDDTLNTHTKQIANLQKKVEDIIVVNNEQHATIASQGGRITETEHRIEEHTTQLELLYSDFVLMQQTIQNLTARIEALEKGGGGSSAVVEDGILSVNASVVNEVMSVQGSVEDGILKL